MTITAPVSLSKIKAEFQGPNNLAAYYRGGPYVPINSQSTISTNINGLAISQFNGASKPAPPPPAPPPPAPPPPAPPPPAPPPPAVGQLVSAHASYIDAHVTLIFLKIIISPNGSIRAQGSYYVEEWFITPEGASAGPLEISGTDFNGWNNFTDSKTISAPVGATSNGHIEGIWQVRRAGQPDTAVTVTALAESHSNAQN